MAITPATLSRLMTVRRTRRCMTMCITAGLGQLLKPGMFYRGNQIPARWANRDSFVIVETGFGLGLNFLTTWATWLAQTDDERCKRLHFVSVEKHPLLKADLIRLLETLQIRACDPYHSNPG